MNAREVLLKKRDGGELSDAQIEDFVAGAVDGTIADYQTSVPGFHSRRSPPAALVKTTPLQPSFAKARTARVASCALQPS